MNPLDGLVWTFSILIAVSGEKRKEESIPSVKEASSLNLTTLSINASESTYRHLSGFDRVSITNKNTFNDDKSYRSTEFDKGRPISRASASSIPLPSRSICGPQSQEERIYGGENTSIDEFPWLVRIKYILDNGKEVYACAGSLITDHYVLTAAHCAVNLTIKEVRLGDWNVETDYDCQDNVCSGAPVDIKVVKVTPFPGYNEMNKFNGDIALLKLHRSVTFTDFIRPVCLPSTDSISKQDYSPGSVFWTAGWGKTEFSKKSAIKRKVELQSVPISTCRLKHQTFTDMIEPFVICAGGSEGKDTCTGDSGGSLVKHISDGTSSNWFLVGVTSYGYKDCGTEGRPGLYVRITSYMDWIVENIRV